jgi:hypothetical protein
LCKPRSRNGSRLSRVRDHGGVSKRCEKVQHASKIAQMSEIGPPLPTWALQKVVG